jgi:hypothetical protein
VAAVSLSVQEKIEDFRNAMPLVSIPYRASRNALNKARND